MFVTNREKRTNTGHAVLPGTRNPPKMKRRNGPTDGPMDGRTDGQTLLKRWFEASKKGNTGTNEGAHLVETV